MILNKGSVFLRLYRGTEMLAEAPIDSASKSFSPSDPIVNLGASGDYYKFYGKADDNHEL